MMSPLRTMSMKKGEPDSIAPSRAFPAAFQNMGQGGEGWGPAFPLKVE